MRPIAGEPLTFEIAGHESTKGVRLAPFFRMAHERYVLYWKVSPA